MFAAVYDDNSRKSKFFKDIENFQFVPAKLKERTSYEDIILKAHLELQEIMKENKDRYQLAIKKEKLFEEAYREL